MARSVALSAGLVLDRKTPNVRAMAVRGHAALADLRHGPIREWRRSSLRTYLRNH
jgi:hypothetical protein